VISKRIVQTAIRGRLWYCLMAVTLCSGSNSLLAQGTASGSHLPEEGFSEERFTVNYVSQLPIAGTTARPVSLAPRPSASAVSH
jgi:hypothetical protein